MMMNRREFIRKAGRTFILGGIVAGSGYLLLKPQSGEQCDLDFICKNCKQNKTCTLPEAESFNKKNEPATN